MQGGVYFFAAFSIVWAFVLGYLFILIRDQRRLRRDIEHLKEMVKGSVERGEDT